MAYETVRMEQNDVLKYYFQRFKALKSGYEDTMRALGVMPDFTEEMLAKNELHAGMKFMNVLNAGYIDYYEHNLKEWPDYLEDAYLEMSKLTPKKTAASTPPNHANVLAMKTAGGEKHPGTDNPKGKSNGNGGRGKGGCTSYGTRPGNCNKCNEPGHYSYE
jgi:hypothetical protein